MYNHACPSRLSLGTEPLYLSGTSLGCECHCVHMGVNVRNSAIPSFRLGVLHECYKGQATLLVAASVHLPDCLTRPKMRFSTTFIVTIFLAISNSSAAQVGVGGSAIQQAANTVHKAANTIQHNAQTVDNAVHGLLSKGFSGAGAAAVRQQLDQADAGIRQALQAYQAIVTGLERAA